jgi:(p)ppGpp synthase/HD superfamily hydrolase
MQESDFRPPKLGRRFEDALVYAAQLHTGQERKENGVPYIAHLLGVAALVIEDGGDEDEAIAALLHDAVEDQGGLERCRAITGRYGEQVARIVMGCTDATERPKPPWRERKERYVAHLRHADAQVLRVSKADKLYNARAVVADLRAVGDDVFTRFRGGKDGTLWYYRAVVEAYRQVGSGGYLFEELERTVAEMERLAGVAVVR